MNGEAIERLSVGTLAVAAMRGWISGVLFGTLAPGIFTIGASAQAAPSVGAFLQAVIMLPLAAVAIIIIGGILALPAPFLAVLLLWPAERFPRHTRNLPAWLAVGLVASLPTAYYLWSMATLLTLHDNPFVLDPAHSWDSLWLPLLVLACGLVGAFVAWRAEGRSTE